MTGAEKTTKKSSPKTAESSTNEPHATQIADFEGALDELEALVEQMEAGDLTLEDSLQAFERGIALTRSCQNALKEAELRVRTLTDADTQTDDAELTDSASELDSSH